MYVFIGLHCLLPEAAIRVEVFCKKGVLKDFVNFVGKHLCWRLFLIKFQARHLFWRTYVNNCFCTALAPLTATYLFYFIFSTIFLIITATTLYISDVSFWFKFESFKEFKCGISFSLKSHFHCCYFLFPCFFCLSQFCFIFLSLLIKRIFLSWELIKMFLPPLTSLNYVHVSK